MTPIMIKKIMNRAISILLFTLLALWGMNIVTQRRMDSQRIDFLEKSVQSVWQDKMYRQLDISAWQPEYKDVYHLFGVYNRNKELEGYVVDILFQLPSQLEYDRKNLMENSRIELINRLCLAKNGGVLLKSQIFRLDYIVQSKWEDTATPDEINYNFYEPPYLENINVPVSLLHHQKNFQQDSDLAAPMEGLQDGVFRAESSVAKDNFFDFVEIVVENSRITSVVWDGKAKDGGKNKVKASIDKELEVKKNQLSWAEQAYIMQNLLVSIQDPDQIIMKSDGTTGVIANVHININEFVRLSKICLENSQAGMFYLPNLTEETESTMHTGPEETKQTDLSTADKGQETLETGEKNMPSEALVPASSSVSSLEVVSGDKTAGDRPADIAIEDGVILDYDIQSAFFHLAGVPIKDTKTILDIAEEEEPAYQQWLFNINKACLFLLDYQKGG